MRHSSDQFVPMLKPTYKIMIVAGETSGDRHAAKLVRAIRESEPNSVFEFFGAAGEKMRDAGVEAIIPADNLSVVGLPEIARALPMFLRAFRSLKQSALERRPDVVVLVDFPDFNLKLAKALSRRGLRIVYYISPQLWAWRRYRIETVRRYVDLVISILPFEREWYEAQGVHHVEYVGSPLAREVYASEGKNDFARRFELDPKQPIVALLPGSRHKEIVRILPVMLKGAARMAEARPDLQFVIAVATGRNVLDVQRTIKTNPTANLRITIVQNETFNVLEAADVAAVTSGTATLETGIIGTPMVIVYKTSALNYGLLRPLINVEHFGLINLIAGQRIATELIQGEFTPETISHELLRLLEPTENAKARALLKAASAKLGQGGASKRAAELILSLVSDRK